MAQLRDLIVTGAARFVNGAYFGGASTFGSATRPVWWNNGFPQATTYSLSATLNAGSANRLAYYSGANAVSASSHYASATQVGINITNIDTIGSRALYVNGTSQFSDDIYANKSIRNLAVGGGLYWNPYVESATDNSDIASITLIKSGIAGGTELQIKQANDQNDVINLVAPYYIYLNNKRAFTVNDSWLRINDTSTFTSGIYTGTSILRTDNQLQVGDAGANFYAKNTGDAFIQKTLGINGVNIGYKLYVNGTAYFNGAVGVNNNVTALQFIGNLTSAYYGSDTADTSGWYKVFTKTTTGYNDDTFNLIITSGYNRQATGLLHVHVRSNNTTTLVLQTLKWMYRYGFNESDVRVVLDGNNWSLYVYQNNVQHGRIQVVLVTKAGTSGNHTMTLTNNNTRETTAPTGTAASDGGQVYYAAQAGNADTLDGYHENKFLRYRDSVGGSGGTSHSNTLWSQIGIRQYNNALPDAMADNATYPYGAVISFPGASSRLDLWYNHQTSSNGDGLRYRTGWNDDKRTWATILDTVNYAGALDGRYVNVAGDTMTGALNFANGTWNKAGDDAQFGDNNTAGSFAIQGINGNTNLKMVTYGNTTYGTITWDGSQFVFSHGISGNASSSSVSERLDSYDTRSATRTPQDTPRGMTLNFKQNSTYGLSDGGSYLGLLSWRSYSSGSDLSGGYPIEIAYTANGNLWTRMGTSATAWGAWNRIIKHSFLQERGLYKDYGYQTSSSNWTSMLAVNQFSVYTNWWDSGTYMPYIYGSGIMIPHLDGNYRSFLHFQCSLPKVWVGWVNKTSTSTPTWKYLWAQGDAVTSAVWNDYAECRKSDSQEPGYVMFEKGDDSLSKTIERLQHFAGIVSDTWGFSQGETADAKTNIAVAGRVLAYPYRDRNEYKPGDCVCAAPGGKVDIMTREEIAQYPDRIVGTVSCVPEYETWGGGELADRDPVKVNGRIWIKVK